MNTYLKRTNERTKVRRDIDCDPIPLENFTDNMFFKWSNKMDFTATIHWTEKVKMDSGRQLATNTNKTKSHANNCIGYVCCGIVWEKILTIGPRWMDESRIGFEFKRFRKVHNSNKSGRFNRRIFLSIVV